jgi:hypothetical protein
MLYPIELWVQWWLLGLFSCVSRTPPILFPLGVAEELIPVAVTAGVN